MIRRPRASIARLMLTVLAASLLLDLVALRRALQPDDLDAATRRPEDASPRLPPDWRGSGAAAADASLPDDPFDPDRGAAVAQAGEPSPAAQGAVSPESVVSLIGTVVRLGGDGVAVCQVGTQPPRMLRLGERIGGLTLLTVEQGSASFRDSNGALVRLRIATPGA